ncbi:MAG: A/G-specific adenine glycosylase [Alphaproteobacteria bacterium]|nr:A/G-specific adenine glycosylase [Alphaproteobacteria bacterium]
MKSSVAQKRASNNKEKQTPSAEALLIWYDQNARLLPWRARKGQKPNPYHVWLSEIMLQQTTVNAVVPYFQRFIEKWPSLKDLAKASLEDILRLWAGLGYYRRARFLHACAQKLGCTFPQDEKTLRSLPGIGPYTAAAISAIAFGRKTNVVDGNVERVMARIFAIKTPLPKAKKELTALAALCVPDRRVGDYAQALMDLGANICTPKTPKCMLCPWRSSCKACAAAKAWAYPLRAPTAVKPLRRAVAFVAFNDRQNKVFLRSRPLQGLLAGMMEVPSSPWEEGKKLALEDALDYAPFKGVWQILQGEVYHSFTHFDFKITVAVSVIKNGRRAKGKWVLIKDLGAEALPSVMRKILAFALKTREET